MIDNSRVSDSSALRRFIADERGDVPGWVLITLMTAGAVITQ